MTNLEQLTKYGKVTLVIGMSGVVAYMATGAYLRYLESDNYKEFQRFRDLPDLNKLRENGL